MRRVIAAVVALIVVLGLGVVAADAMHTAVTEQHVVPFTIGTVTGAVTITDTDTLPHETVTVTTTVTVTSPPPATTTTTTEPPPPPPSNCTDVLAAGGDLSTFLSSVVSGDVGCLRGGDYTDGATLTWSGANATLQSFPGETARVHTELHLNGPDLTLRNFTISNTATTCNAGASTTGCDGVRISGARARLLDMTIENTDRHGVLFHSSASNGLIARTLIRNTGQTNTTLEHGVYFQGNGHTLINSVLAEQRGGYGIQLFPSAGGVTVAQNTVADTLQRPSIVINTSGSGNRVVNNVFANGINLTGNGIGPGGLVSTNLTANPGFIDTAYHVGPTSPAVDAGRADLTFIAFSPDRDGVTRPQGAGPDIGAYER